MSTESLMSNCVSSSNNFSDEYELKHVIGQGTFSDVYLCVHRWNDSQQYAAKVLKKDYGQTMDETAWKTISELKVVNATKKHPFILSIELAFHEQQTGKIILLSELMNRSLHELIAEGQCPLPDDRIKEYMYQMLEGLKFIHESGFIHRDIKPENILLKCRDKLLKIGDLGSVCSVSHKQEYAEYIATRWFRSPECMLTRGRYGTKLDIWAAGCVLYEMATGLVLFDGDDVNDQMEKIDHVLGCPDAVLLNKFRKYKSDVFVDRYEKRRDSEQITSGVGLHTMYQPFKPAYEILKEMIVYNPIKRFSADRLLRKPYFYKMKFSRYECKIIEFQNAMLQKPIRHNSSAAGEKKTIQKKITQRSRNKKGPSGDRISNNFTTKIAQNEDQLIRIVPTNNENKLIDHEDSNTSSTTSNEMKSEVEMSLQDIKDKINISIIQKSEFIHPDNRVSTVRSKPIKKISFTEKRQITRASVPPTLGKFAVTKLVNKKIEKRPPFK